MAKNLLLEIGTEELPSSCIIEVLKNFKNILSAGLEISSIEFNSCIVLATPRRIIAYADNLSEMQKSTEKVLTGPPLKIAYESTGKYTQAALGFAKSLGIDAARLVEVETDKGVYIGYRYTEEPKKTADLLPGILKKAIFSLSFSKQMTWGNYSFKFARPIRWIAALFNGSVIEFEIENVCSSDKTYSHRASGNRQLEIKEISSFTDYINFLENSASVMPESSKRREMILGQINNIEKNSWNGKMKAVLDDDLIKEVVNLVEIPNVLSGTFPKQYLYIPREILIKAIQHHQRYFAVIDQNGLVTTNFITVQNGLTDKTGAIIKGNERVLKARLSDAKFFYEEDKNSSFKSWFEKLKGMVFYSKMGSLYDKALRLEKICIFIKNHVEQKGHIFNNPGLAEDLSKASRFCKCDLVTNLVVEFPELQGLVGREYALERGENKSVSDAIFEHYLPRFSDDLLPESDTGAILSIADKIDTITGIFLAGSVPSGSEDPLALRRKASGIILGTLKKNYNIDILKLAEYSAGLFNESFSAAVKNFGQTALEITDFIFARYKFKLEKEQKRTDIFEAIRSTGLAFTEDIDLKYTELFSYLDSGGNLSLLAEPMIRCKNIIKDKKFTDVESSLFKEEAEKVLYRELIERQKCMKEMEKSGEFKSMLDELSGFSVFINDFFDKVLVMDKDEKLRQNRINLIKCCLDMYFLYADFSKIL